MQYKFDEKYKFARSYQPMTLSMEVEVEPGVWWIGRVAKCRACGARTAFAIYLGGIPATHVCSNECVNEMRRRSLETENDGQLASTTSNM